MNSIEATRNQFARPDVTVNAVKLFFDGVIEFPTQTAAMIRPYRENQGTDDDPHWVPGDWSGPTYSHPRSRTRGSRRSTRRAGRCTSSKT